MNYANDKVNVGFSLSKKALCIVAIPFSIQLMMLFQYGVLVERVERLARQEYYSKAVLNHGNWVTILLSVAANSLSAFATSKDRDYKSIFENCLRALPSSYKETADLIEASSPQMISLKAFEATGHEAEQRLRSLLIPAEAGKYHDVSVGLSDTRAKALWLKLYQGRHDLLVYNRVALKNDPEALPSARQAQKLLLLTIFTSDVVAAFFLIYSFNVQIGRKLSYLAKNATFLGARKELLAPLSGSDEIAYLDAALHKASAELSIAQRKLEESEARLKNVIEHMPVGLITLDSGGTLATANSEIQKLLNVHEESLLGKRLEQFLPNLGPLNDLPSDTQTQEIQIARDDERPLILEFSLKNYPSMQGNLVLVALHDVTARRELEQMRQDFLNMVSHDLRSPLTSLRLFFNLLSRGAYGSINESGVENLIRAERNVDRLLNMINDLLDFEKMQAGQIALEIEDLAVEEVVATASDLIQGIAEKSNITLQAVHADSYLRGDRERLVQVMVNLMSNAVKFSPAGETVTVESIEVGDFVEVRVIDRGRGIPPEKLDIIFDKFIPQTLR
jgi:PAS domain S-box-containing protein